MDRADWAVRLGRRVRGVRQDQAWRDDARELGADRPVRLFRRAPLDWDGCARRYAVQRDGRRHKTLVELAWTPSGRDEVPVAILNDGDIGEAQRWIEALRAGRFEDLRFPRLPSESFVVDRECLGVCGHKIYAGAHAIGDGKRLFCSSDCAEAAQ